MWRCGLLRVCLLECSVREVRVVVASILEKTLESALHFGDPGLDNLTDALLSLLDKDVPENVKNCAQYFGLFSNFAQRVRNQQLTHSLFQQWRMAVKCFRRVPSQGCGPCQLLLKHAAYRRMLVFLLGPNRQNNQVNLSFFCVSISARTSPHRAAQKHFSTTKRSGSESS